MAHFTTEQQYTEARELRKRLRKELAALSVARHWCEESLKDLNSDLDRIIKKVRAVEMSIADWEGRYKVISAKTPSSRPRTPQPDSKPTEAQLVAYIERLSDSEVAALIKRHGLGQVLEVGDD